MSADDGGGELTTGEAAEHLRRLRDTLGPDQLREAFETGGGLMEHEENRLREALDVLGTQRTAEILDIEVPDSGLPGEQVTIGGEPLSGRVPEERAEPVPDDTASLSEFDRDDEDDECERVAEQVRGVLASARRQGQLEFNEFDHALSAAEREGCISSADATRLRDTAQTAAPEPTRQQIDQLTEDVDVAFAGGSGNG